MIRKFEVGEKVKWSKELDVIREVLENRMDQDMDRELIETRDLSSIEMTPRPRVFKGMVRCGWNDLQGNWQSGVFHQDELISIG